MELHEVSITRFGPYREPTQVTLQGQPGLVFLAGRNEVEPRLGANGAGKSKLFEAVYWCLYGKTSRNLKAGEVASWMQDEATEVRVILRTAASTFDVYRSWQKGHMNKLVLTDTRTGEVADVDQQRLDEALGLNETEFLYSIYFAQHASYFIDLSASEQLELYSYVLNIDYWERLANAANKKAGEEVAYLERARLARARAGAYLVQVEDKLEEYQELEVEELRERIAAEKAVYDELHALEKSRPAKLDLGKLQELQKLSEEIEQAVADAKLQEREAARELKKIEEWKANVGDVCPRCRQKVSKKHIASETDEASAKWREQLEGATKALEEWIGEMDAVGELLKAEHEAAEARQRLIDRLEELEADLNALFKRTSKFTDLIRRTEDELMDAQLRLVEDSGAVTATADKVEALKYWSKGFKDIRLFVVDESLAQLEFEVNSALQAFGLEEWRVEFDVEKEAKNGNVKRGFSLLVYAPDQDQPVNFKSYSGGEAQRVRLACAIGFASLIQQHKGIEARTEMWDEPTAALAEEGINDLLAQLSSRATGEQKRVFLADHRSLHFGGFVDTMTVVKTEKGSRVDV